MVNGLTTGVELVVKRGETIALVGESGSGKSTLLPYHEEREQRRAEAEQEKTQIELLGDAVGGDAAEERNGQQQFEHQVVHILHRGGREKMPPLQQLAQNNQDKNWYGGVETENQVIHLRRPPFRPLPAGRSPAAFPGSAPE